MFNYKEIRYEEKTMNRNEQKPIILFKTFLCSVVKTLIVIMTTLVCSFCLCEHFMTLKMLTEFILAITTSSYAIIIILSLISWILNERIYDLSVIIFHFLYGTLAHICAVLLKSELPVASPANYFRELSFTVLGLLSYIYAGFFLLYPKLKPIKEKSEKVSKKEVKKVKKEKSEDKALFIYIPLNEPSQNTTYSSLDLEAESTSTSPQAVPGTSSKLDQQQIN